MYGEEGEGAFEALAGELHGLGEAALRGVALELVPVDVAQERGGNFGVSLGEERHSLAHELQLELGEIFDDAVVNDSQLALIGEMRVRVPVCRSAVGRPARVTDAGQRFRQRVGLEFGNQVAQFARLLAGRNGAVRNDGDACRVVAPVFQAPQSLKDNVQGIVSSIYPASGVAHISNDSTHGLKPSGFLGQRT